jgi:hypothetical protein
MTRVQRYHRNHSILAYTILAANVIACLAFDFYVIAAWLAL